MSDRRAFLKSIAATAVLGAVRPALGAQAVAEQKSTTIHKSTLISMLPRELSYADRFAMAREHVGEGRCRRCGFVYSGQVRLCPTARRIAAELESRSKAPVTQPRAGQGLCAGKGSAWNVTGREAAPWKRAIAACSICPLLAQCEAELESRLAAGAKISEQIIAGSPDEVLRRLLLLIEETGPFGTLALMSYDWDDKASWLHSMELFARELMPALNKAVCGTAV